MISLFKNILSFQSWYIWIFIIIAVVLVVWFFKKPKKVDEGYLVGLTDLLNVVDSNPGLPPTRLYELLNTKTTTSDLEKPSNFRTTTQGKPKVKTSRTKRARTKRTKPKQAKRPKRAKTGRFNKNEERCRDILENIFRKRFKSIRPNFLKSPATGHNLELDCFNSSVSTPIGVGLALEYDGRQHAEFVPHFHRNGKEQFTYQTKKDMFKTVKCREQGVVLLRVPHTVRYEDLEMHIRGLLRGWKILA